jgi:hypothetical protein
MKSHKSILHLLVPAILAWLTVSPAPAGTVLERDGFEISTVPKQTPVVTWPAPGLIFYGTPLGPAQLSATADVGGIFIYHPPAGTILNAGSRQVLGATFIPYDTDRYEIFTATTTLDVYRRYVEFHVDGKVKYSGQPNPPLTATWFGLTVGEIPADLETPLVLSTTATTDSPPGRYPILTNGVSDPNYDIRYASGGVLLVLALTNEPGPLDVTFDPTQNGQAPGFSPCTIRTLAVQPDGKIVAGGAFRQFNDTPCNGLVRLNPDGSLDAAINLRPEYDWVDWFCVNLC